MCREGYQRDIYSARTWAEHKKIKGVGIRAQRASNLENLNSYPTNLRKVAVIDIEVGGTPKMMGCSNPQIEPRIEWGMYWVTDLATPRQHSGTQGCHWSCEKGWGDGTSTHGSREKPQQVQLLTGPKKKGKITVVHRLDNPNNGMPPNQPEKRDGVRWRLHTQRQEGNALANKDPHVWWGELKRSKVDVIQHGSHPQENQLSVCSWW